MQRRRGGDVNGVDVVASHEVFNVSGRRRDAVLIGVPTGPTRVAAGDRRHHRARPGIVASGRLQFRDHPPGNSTGSEYAETDGFARPSAVRRSPMQCR